MVKNLFIIAFCAVVAACGPSTTLPASMDMYIYTNQETGCQYLKPSSDSGFVPRMNKDGKQICK